MSSIFQRYIQFADKLIPWVIAAFFVGSGIAYGHLRLFHLLGILVLPYLLYKAKERHLFRQESYYWLGVLVFAAYLLSTLWAPYKKEAINYCFYVANGIFAISCGFFYTNSRASLKKVIQYLSVVFCLDLVIGLIESVSDFKWFISRMSPYNTTLGVDPMYESYLTNLAWRKDNMPESYEFLARQPMSFHWGPNQYGLMLCLALPFILFTVKNKKIKTFLVAAVYFLMFMVASRAVFYGLLATTILALVMKQTDRATKTIAATLLMVTLIVPILPLKNFNINFERRNKLLTIYATASRFFVNNGSVNIESEALGIGNQAEMTSAEDGSLSSRKKMILDAWSDFKKTNGLGIGAGGSLQNGNGLFGKTQIHNYWLEVFFELGIVLFPIFALWYSMIFTQLLKLFKTAETSEDKNLLLAIMAAGVAAIPGVLAVGTAAYQTAFWTSIVVAVATIKGLRSEKAPACAPLNTN